MAQRGGELFIEYFEKKYNIKIIVKRYNTYENNIKLDINNACDAITMLYQIKRR